MGKFLYPRKHAAFFEQPMLFQPATIGTFSLTQLLGNLNTRLQKQKQKQREAARKAKDAPELKKFHKKDFYNRTFYVTATPHPVHQGYAAQDIHYDESTAYAKSTLGCVREFCTFMIGTKLDRFNEPLYDHMCNHGEIINADAAPLAVAS